MRFGNGVHENFKQQFNIIIGRGGQCKSKKFCCKRMRNYSEILVLQAFPLAQKIIALQAQV